mmetsp:Transcript_38749/g.91784  ORF Transcript_38749/g.91784 Transcript_38749/m.91784 type:complete len:726 (+) Transcript_38749:550-2727(+)
MQEATGTPPSLHLPGLRPAAGAPAPRDKRLRLGVEHRVAALTAGWSPCRDGDGQHRPLALASAPGLRGLRLGWLRRWRWRRTEAERWMDDTLEPLPSTESEPAGAVRHEWLVDLGHECGGRAPRGLLGRPPRRPLRPRRRLLCPHHVAAVELARLRVGRHGELDAVPDNERGAALNLAHMEEDPPHTFAPRSRRLLSSVAAGAAVGRGQPTRPPGGPLLQLRPPLALAVICPAACLPRRPSGTGSGAAVLHRGCCALLAELLHGLCFPVSRLVRGARGGDAVLDEAKGRPHRHDDARLAHNGDLRRPRGAVHGGPQAAGLHRLLRRPQICGNAERDGVPGLWAHPRDLRGEEGDVPLQSLVYELDEARHARGRRAASRKVPLQDDARVHRVADGLENHLSLGRRAHVDGVELPGCRLPDDAELNIRPHRDALRREPPSEACKAEEHVRRPGAALDEPKAVLGRFHPPVLDLVDRPPDQADARCAVALCEKVELSLDLNLIVQPQRLRRLALLSFRATHDVLDKAAGLLAHLRIPEQQHPRAPVTRDLDEAFCLDGRPGRELVIREDLHPHGNVLLRDLAVLHFVGHNGADAGPDPPHELAEVEEGLGRVPLGRADEPKGLLERHNDANLALPGNASRLAEGLNTDGPPPVGAAVAGHREPDACPDLQRLKVFAVLPTERDRVTDCGHRATGTVLVWSAEHLHHLDDPMQLVLVCTPNRMWAGASL